MNKGFCTNVQIRLQMEAGNILRYNYSYCLVKSVKVLHQHLESGLTAPLCFKRLE